MQSIDISAKSVQEATKTAADKLGVSPENVKITVLEETKGLFGKSSVRVRAEVLEVVAAVAAPAAAAPAAKPARGRIGASKTAAKAEPAPEPVAVVAPVEEPKAEAPKKIGRSAKPKKEEPVAAAAEPAAEAAEEGDSAEAVVATQADADKLIALVKEIVDNAGLEISVNAGQLSGRYVNVLLDGKDVAYLVGKHGEVLNALQYLINIMAGRRFNNGVRVTLDGNDFRRRREDQLTQLAKNIADQVKERGEEAVLDALPAFERRIVHKALSEYEGISTYSEGEEPNRRVVIAPAD